MYEYKDLIDLVKQDDYSEQDVYLLSNHNGELFGQNHLNILDARSFSIDLIHEVNHRLLTIPGKNVTYDTLELDQEAFVDRIDSLAAYYKEIGDFRNHGVLKGIEQTVLHLEPGSATEDEKEKLRKGKLSINKVYTEKQKGKLLPADFPKGKYDVIYSNFFEETKEGWAPKKSIFYLCALPVKDLLKKKAVLFLVATPAYLKETLRVMKAWGFEYSSLFVMEDQSYLKGLYVKDERHLVLIGTKDKVLPDQLPSFLMKGKDLHKLIDTSYTKGARIDLFGTEEKKGWAIYR